MAGGQERVLRRRIRSVQSTRKITKAMELIAASRIVRATSRIAANRPYRDGMQRILRAVVEDDPNVAAKMLGTPESPERVGIVAIVGDRGLAGSYNSGVLRATERLVAEYERANVEVVALERRQEGPGLFQISWHRGGTVVRRHGRPSGVRRRPRDRRGCDGAVPGRRDRPAPAHLDRATFRPGRSASRPSSCCPCRPRRTTHADEGADLPSAGGPGAGGYTEFEPDGETLLAELAPRAAESEIFAALLEGSAAVLHRPAESHGGGN